VILRKLHTFVLHQTKEIMANIFNDLNKLVNTVQKVDKILSEKPKRKKTKSTINDSLENLIQAIMSRPRNELIGNLNYVIDNLNELGIDYTIELKTK
jgi:hypothetical protein